MINYNLLPYHMQDGMRRYIEQGIEPGSFLRSVLENNLIDAFSHADDVNRYRMIDYASFLFNEAPSNCWGSPEKVNVWIKEKLNDR